MAAMGSINTVEPEDDGEFDVFDGTAREGDPFDGSAEDDEV